MRVSRVKFILSLTEQFPGLTLYWDTEAGVYKAFLFKRIGPGASVSQDVQPGVDAKSIRRNIAVVYPKFNFEVSKLLNYTLDLQVEG